MFVGFAGQGYKLDQQVLLKPGQQAALGHYTIRHDSVQVTDDGAKQMVTAHVTVFRGGKEIGTLQPGKWFYRKHEQEPASQIAIRRSFGEDLYLVMPAFDLKDQSASFEIVVNPLVNWIWAGFGVLALGTLIALLPESSFAFAAARVPGGAATTLPLLLALLLPAGRGPKAGNETPDVDRTRPPVLNPADAGSHTGSHPAEGGSQRASHPAGSGETPAERSME
jgi:cytochrome c-type biogenesis protein CcmF